MSKTGLKVLIAVTLVISALITAMLAQAKWYEWIMTNNITTLKQYTDAVAGACVLATLSIVAWVSAVISHRNYE
jgi:uncharacterized membrane protein YidH (DUF202 family)